MFLYDTTSDEVKNVIDKLEGKTSCSVDDISSKVVKYVAPFISVPLSHIYNLTFSSGKILDQFKVALVTPVYKSSDKNTFCNYRPISVLPCFAKTLEKLMYKRLNTYRILTGIAFHHTTEFRNRSSTNHAIVELVHKIR